MNCPIHNLPLKTVPAGVSKKTGRPYNSFQACPEQGCTYRPPRQENYAPKQPYSVTGAPKRNFDREAYEKCCSIWLGDLLANGITLQKALSYVSEGEFWMVFQAIRKDGEKRFASGWNKAVQVFGTDTEAGNRAIEQVQSEPPPEETW